jgi:uncharacterized protein YjbI with pentapeptide repeats
VVRDLKVTNRLVGPPPGASRLGCYRPAGRPVGKVEEARPTAAGSPYRHAVISRLAVLWHAHRAAVLIVGALAAAALVGAFIWPITDLIAAHDVGLVAPAQRAVHLQTARESVRTQLVTLGAGLFAAGALLYTARNFTLSRRTFELTEQGQVTDRYTKAIEQLGSKELDVRIGGIYALERVARDSPRDHPTVMEVLTAFVREHSREHLPDAVGDEPGTEATERMTRPDVQAAVTVVGRRDRGHDRQQISLAGADLPRADLTSANLVSAYLHAANLGFANLTGADLTGADLTYADLTRALLAGANLTHAHLSGADLTRALLADANLVGAQLAEADLTSAHLNGADLTYADLTGARLPDAGLAGANLTRARLPGADLTHAHLTDANLTGANLTGANLTGADLTGANLTDTNLTDADLTGAILTESQPVPEGWMRDPDFPRLRRADGTA